MSVEKVIEGLETLEVRLRGMDKRICDRALLPIAISLLRTHPDAQPNEPLTLEELREMVGQPVWVEGKGGVYRRGWSLVYRVTAGGAVFLARDQQLYGILKEEWAAGVQLYRRPPKEEPV